MSSPFGFAQGKLCRDILPGMLRVLYLKPDPSISVGMTKNAAFAVHIINKYQSPENKE
jgi:hypothetical protein